MNRTKRLFIALGSNLGDRAAKLASARALLQKIAISPINCSPIYQCPSQGVENLPDFYNQVVEIQSEWTAFDILCFLKGAEIILGRQNRQRWHSREIDLDLIWYDYQVIREKYYNVPHKEIQNRRFVLQPMVDLDPTLVIPILNKPVKQLLGELIEKGQTSELRSIN